MSVHTVDGVRFDTNKVKHKWHLHWLDNEPSQHARYAYTGYVYWFPESKVCVVYTWTNQHSWETMSMEEVLCNYDKYLKDDEKKEMMGLAGLKLERV